MRLDAHQHFWKYNPAEHIWMTDTMAALKRNYLPRDLAPLLSASGIDGCIAVQACQNIEETRWLLELAEQDDFIKGVVGWVELCSEELPQQLERFARHPRLVGVRHIVQDEPDDEFMLRSAFRAGIARLADHDLAYDLLLYPRHLPVAVKLVREFQNQRFVLDHIAKPGIAGGIISPWEQDLRALADYPNVWCKISGMVTEARWKGWTREDFRPYLDVVLDAFGAERLMIGSDWPVCTLSGDYAATMSIAKDFVASLPAQARNGVLGKNCAAFYRVKQ
jgi:L-fuconolactonase